MLPVGAPLCNDAGNAFAASAGDAGVRLPWGGPMVDVTWEPDGALVIRHDATAQEFHAAEAVYGVAMHSESLP